MCRSVAFILLLVVASAAGADSITFDKEQPKPTPGGQEKTLEGKGQLVLDPANELDEIVFFARGPGAKMPEQLNRITAEAVKQNWQASLLLPEGDYEVWVVLRTRDKKTGGLTVTESKPVKVSVKKLQKG